MKRVKKPKKSRRNKTIVSQELIENLILNFIQEKFVSAERVNNFQIREFVKTTLNCNLTDSNVRRYINDIRNRDTILLMLADTKGYFIAQSKTEVLEWIETHKKKIASMQITLESLERQLGRKELLSLYFGEKF